MLASSGAVPGDQAGWSYEVKWDGWRALVYVDGGGVKGSRQGLTVELGEMGEGGCGHRGLLPGAVAV
jgi:hypothetical protein